jgi:hypothetical protein
MEEEYEFTLILDGIPAFTPEILDAFYEAGCDDGLLSRCDGVVSIDFGRTAPSREEAIVSAIRDIEKANVGARVKQVEPDAAGPDDLQDDLATAVNSVLATRLTLASFPRLASLLPTASVR